MIHIDSTMSDCGYTKILADKVIPSVRKLGGGGIFQHDNNSNHSAKIRKELLKMKMKAMKPLGYSEEKARVTQPLQQRRAERKRL